MLAWAHIMIGLSLAEQATSAGTRENVDNLFAEAQKEFGTALEIKPEMHQALNNSGHALNRQAKTGEEEDRLYALAGEKFAQAQKIKPRQA